MATPDTVPHARTALVLLVDAFRWDYLSAENTPFLHSQLDSGFLAPLHPILGYSDAIRATVFTGAYPRDHGYWIMTKYSPGTSPLKLLKPLRFLDGLPGEFFQRSMKFWLSASLGRVLGRIHHCSPPSTHNLPFRLLDRFDSTMSKSMLEPGAFPGYPTIFEMASHRGFKHAFLDASLFGLRARFGSSLRVRGKLVAAVGNLPQDTRLAFVYLHHLDHFAHRFTTSSPRFIAELRNVDSTIEAIVSKARERWGSSLEVIIFSDHGMADATHFHDLRELVRDRGLGRDFLLSLDSTMVRVWYFNPTRRDDVRRRVEALGCGRFLSAEEKQALKVDFGHRDYGDDIYLLEPGHTLFPNFISWIKPFAMHAYHPDHPSQTGIFFWLNRRADISHQGPVELVDIAPSLSTVLGLPPVPTFRGTSLLG